MPTLESVSNLDTHQSWMKYAIKGPWNDEPDEWIREMAGAVRHTELGHWCGYVAVTKGHPLYEAGTRYTQGMHEYSLDVHGGVTYTDYNFPGREPYGDLWWIGFDCGHLYDMSPYMALIAPALTRGTYRDLEYVKAQIVQLAKQLYMMRKEVSCVQDY